MSFKDKVVIITGASSGIGAAIAEEFANEGANVTITGRNQDNLNKTAKVCEQGSNTVLKIIADVTKEDEARIIVEKTIEQFGRLDVLINNAGAAGYITIKSKNTMESYDEIVNLNLRACVHLTHLAVPHLMKTKGNIINISSILGKICNDGSFSYCVSKAGLDMFTKCMGKELAADGIRVNSISPGSVKTNIMLNSGFTSAQEETDAFYDKKAETSPMKKLVQLIEVAHLALFLASDKASTITASDFVIDGAQMR